MNKEKVYIAPSAEMLILAPVEELAGVSWSGSWKADGFFRKDDNNPYSGVAINGNLADWAEDGYTYNGSTS